MNSETQRSPEPTMRRTVKRLKFGCTGRGAWMLCRPLMRSPDCGYSSSASSRYMSCSASKSFASEAAQWRLSASRILFSSIPAIPVPRLVIEFWPRLGQGDDGSLDLMGTRGSILTLPLEIELDRGYRRCTADQRIAVGRRVQRLWRI